MGVSEQQKVESAEKSLNFKIPVAVSLKLLDIRDVERSQVVEEQNKFKKRLLKFPIKW